MDRKQKILAAAAFAKKKSYHRWKLQGLCTRCGKQPRGTTLQCITCSQVSKLINTAHKREQYYIRRARSLCVKCGRQRQGPALVCESCRTKQATARARKKEECRRKVT